MVIDTLTIILDGEVPLREFAQTIERFSKLVRALSNEVGVPNLDWILDDLQVSSAVATIRASGDSESAEKVVAAYAEVGHALETNSPIRYSHRVRAAAQRVVSINDPRVRSVRFETPIREAVVKIVRPNRSVTGSTDDMGLFHQQTIAPVAPTFTTVPAYGGIQGRVQALSNRGGLRFTVYDLFYDKAIGCYVEQEKEELLRNIWGKLATIEGIITRDPMSGRPLSVRKVTNITPMPEPYFRREYEEARGVAPSLGGLSPEEAIRRIRDA